MPSELWVLLDPAAAMIEEEFLAAVYVSPLWHKGDLLLEGTADIEAP